MLIVTGFIIIEQQLTDELLIHVIPYIIIYSLIKYRPIERALSSYYDHDFFMTCLKCFKTEENCIISRLRNLNHIQGSF